VTRDALRRWTPVVVLVLLFAGALACLERGRRGAREAGRLAEAEALRQAGIAVAAQTDSVGVRGALQAQLRRSAELAAEVAKLKRASPGVRPVATTTATTGPVPVSGAAAIPGSALRCVLFEGDQGEVRLASATFATRGGNLVFVGAAEAWRASPAPAVRLFVGALAAETTVERVPVAPGWGGGLSGSVGSDGWMAGAAVALPPARLWGWQGEAVLRAEMGPTGWSAGATGVVRRWR
jgi:hypothetical protein